MTAIAILHRDEIIERVRQGEYLAPIAASLGLKGKGQAISNALADDPEYAHAREAGLEVKLSKREAELEESEKDDVPRARELLSHARWRAETEARHRWGKSPSVVVNQFLGGDAALDGIAAGLVDRIRTVSEQKAE